VAQVFPDARRCRWAIAKLAVANKKGPHFANSMELWGEA